MTQFLVIFGATGDVAKRYVFPALGYLASQGCLPDDLTILGVGRRAWTRKTFQEHVSDLLNTSDLPHPPAARNTLLPLLEYGQVNDLSDVGQVRRLFNGQRGGSLIYLGLPPALFSPVLGSLEHMPLPPDSRIIIEKPFGLNYDEAKALNVRLHRQFGEEAVFRIDHFLGKSIVSHILDLRIGQDWFESLWGRHHIDKIEVVWDETLTLEGRADYYDRAGALKDMIQNHLLQLLAVLALEPPESMCSPDFRDKRVEVLRSVRKMSRPEIQAHTVRAQYRSGHIDGKRISDYVREPGVDPDRQTETFAQITLWIDNARWQGVPFVLRSGKAIKKDRNEIAVYFKPHTNGGRRPQPGKDHPVLRWNLSSEEINLELGPLGGSKGKIIEPVRVDDRLGHRHLPPYGRLFLEAMSGNSTLFVRSDEVEEMWKIIQPIADGWEENIVPLQMYRAGSCPMVR